MLVVDRRAWWLLAVSALALELTALWFQYGMGLDPCVKCVYQRLAVMGLVVVVALILGLAWVLKKYGRLPVNNQVEMKVLGGLSLGTREKAVLVQVEGKRLLLGVAPGRGNTLHVMGEDAEEFSQTLHHAMDQQS